MTHLNMRSLRSDGARPIKYARSFANSVPITQNYEQSSAFVVAIGAANESVNFREIHDQDKERPAIKRRGTLEQHWQELCDWNNKGYGIFATISLMDGTGYDASGHPITGQSGDKLANVTAMRAHYIDCDQITAMDDARRAASHFPPPQFWVQTSPNKAHVYWVLGPQDRYNDGNLFSQQQAKLAQLYSGDPRITDPTRVLRLPGFLHLKGAPHLVTCAALPGRDCPTMPGALAVSLAAVNVIQPHSGTRKPLGDLDLAAPSLHWVDFAFRTADPNDMDRAQWIAFTAAIKQAMWTHVDANDAFARWSAWCERYEHNDPGENLKQWNDLEETQIGWRWIEREFPTIAAHRRLGPPATQLDSGQPALPMPQDGAQAMPVGDILTAEEQAIRFAGCVLIDTENRIIGADNVSRDTGAFNAKYGGKLFILDSHGKLTDEPWKAVTRGRSYSVPKVQFTFFRPDLEPRAIIRDELNRTYVNTYFPARIAAQPGDISLFSDHMNRILPNKHDQEMLFDYMAHNLKYPGVKISWAPVLQSAEGVGKGVIKRVIRHGIGGMYFYEPKAKELAESGAKFNGWMENKLFFLVDEVKTDDRREMVEILKPFITETRLEVQGKGRDQRMGDTPGNWLFFTNHKDAIPVTKNARRFAIYYSALQSADDILAAGMNDAYFNRLYGWLDRHGGCEMVAHWLMQRPIPCGGLPSRAPVTSSTDEAIEESKGWLEQFISEVAEEGAYGFRAGWISSKMLSAALARDGRNVAAKTLAKALEEAGYHKVGRLQSANAPEADHRTCLWHRDKRASLQNYIPEQNFRR